MNMNENEDVMYSHIYSKYKTVQAMKAMKVVGESLARRTRTEFSTARNLESSSERKRIGIQEACCQAADLVDFTWDFVFERANISMREEKAKEEENF